MYSAKFVIWKFLSTFTIIKKYFPLQKKKIKNHIVVKLIAFLLFCSESKMKMKVLHKEDFKIQLSLFLIYIFIHIHYKYVRESFLIVEYC